MFSTEFYELRKQMAQWDRQNCFDFAKKKALEQGREEGREEERMRAFAEKKEIAKKLKIKGLDFKMISDATGLIIEEIIAL